MHKIVSTLFKQQQETVFKEEWQAAAEDVPLITKEELLTACKRVGDAKAPGLDGIPNIALKTAVRAQPRLFLEVYNACLLEGTFPRRWKEQRLVLLPKGKKPLENPSSYRPLCLLVTTGKILERIICNRLEKFTEGKNGLADNQYGFRKARSTIDAINRVISVARGAIEGKRWKRGAKKYCAIIALDVKNAFNSARWSHIVEALYHLGVPKYAMRLVVDYFRDRTLKYDTDDGPRAYRITSGVPQGSVLGPILWNVMYDTLLRLQLPAGAHAIGFADDVALTVVAKYIEEVAQVANNSIEAVRRWLHSTGLQLADQKTEVVLVSSRKQKETITISVGSREITSRSSMKYLGVLIDERLRFSAHIKYASEKAAKTTAALARIMPNVGGPRQSRRKLLSSVASSILLYAAPIWASAMSIKTYARHAISVHRLGAMRVASAFRTVSYDAVCVVAGMQPIELLADERQRAYQRERRDTSIGRGVLTSEEKGNSLEQWQQTWETSTKGRWTYRLIPSVKTWMERQHGEIDYFLTQMLTGHGCFRAYQYRFNLDDDHECPTCPGVAEDAEHVFFACPRFQEERNELCRLSQQILSPENIIELMLVSQENWDAVATFARNTLKSLRLQERSRKRDPVELS